MDSVRGLWKGWSLMKCRPEVRPFLAAVLAGAVLAGLGARLAGLGNGVSAAIVGAAWLAGSAYMLFFFRDPDRIVPGNPLMIVAGADGVVARITQIREERFLNAEAIRISIFLSLFDVHVNRAPMSGRSAFLGYYPGKRHFTFREKSSWENQHNAILINGERTQCVVLQIVGPFCRRVVYWLDHAAPVSVGKGARIGMMKFGSRLDMIFPKGDIEVIAREGDTVRAGETVVARIRTTGEDA